MDQFRVHGFGRFRGEKPVTYTCPLHCVGKVVDKYDTVLAMIGGFAFFVASNGAIGRLTQAYLPKGGQAGKALARLNVVAAQMAPQRVTTLPWWWRRRWRPKG